MKNLQKIIAIALSAIMLITMAITGVYADIKGTPKLSEAEKYSCGDVDGDKDINMKDVVTVQKHIAELSILEDVALKAADVTVDGEVNMYDVTTLQKYIAKLIEKLPFGSTSSDEDIETDTSSTSEIDTEVETNTDSYLDTEMESNTNTDTNLDTEAESDTSLDINSDIETEVDTTTDTNLDTDISSDISTDSDTETDTEKQTYLITLDIERYPWEHVYAYLWEETVPEDGQEAELIYEPAAWPGLEMTRDPSTGYYVLDISDYTNCNKVVFSNGNDGSGNQTQNFNLSFVSIGSAHYILTGYIKY